MEGHKNKFYLEEKFQPYMPNIQTILSLHMSDRITESIY